MQVQAPKGTKDVLPSESYRWQYLEGIIRQTCLKYGFKEVRTPVIEHTELFLRSIGDTTDIVQKEMYTFIDKGDRSITLKPEGTAGIVRMFIEHGIFNESQPTKLYYLNSPTFRYERPQAGRLREHHQFGVEMFGAMRASADAECIMLAKGLFDTIGIKELELHLNSIGCPECRPDYNGKLKAYFKEHVDELCGICRDRLERNPLRILDCKEDRCKAVARLAPKTIECLCQECADHLDELKLCLDATGTEYVIDPFVVRGLDYYTRTVFEFVSKHIGSQGTVCGGGRYDLLVEQSGGPHTPAVGFGLGMERLLMVAQNQGVEFPEQQRMDVYIVSMDEQTRIAGYKLANDLRGRGYIAETDHIGRSVKAQFKYAGKMDAQFVAVIGQDELAKGVVKLKNMDTGEDAMAEMDNISDYIERWCEII